MKNPTLSICIATYNRGAFIGATLESIISQATEEVEIVIVDGGSTDRTEHVVGEYQRRFAPLRYHRQEENGGFDRDFNHAVEAARGEYCWLFTDDDLLRPGAIQRVLEAIALGYELIIVNADVRSPNLTKVLRSRVLPITFDRLYKPGESERLFADVANYLSYIGGVIIRRQLWIARDQRSYFGTWFVHVGVIFQSPLPGEALAIADPLVSMRYANASWNPRRFEIWMFKWPGVIWSFPQYSEAAKNRVCPRAPWRSIKTMLLLRGQGAFSPSEYSQLEPHLGSELERLMAKLIVRLPGTLVNLLGVFYCSFVHPASRIALADLMNSPFYPWKRPKQGPLPQP